MLIDKNFFGANIAVSAMENGTVFLEREIRDTQGDWFFWAFRAVDCGGRTLTFQFPKGKPRVGNFGVAVSHDLHHWHWSEGTYTKDSFTYTFAPDENEVFFAHNMIYSPAMFYDFCLAEGLTVQTLCLSNKKRTVPFVQFGNGEKKIVFSSRHHACESTGTYVLQGATEYLHRHMPAEYSVSVIPFTDMDGVTDGDQGKNRKPHDHNRDYVLDPAEMLYPETKAIRSLIEQENTVIFFDFHSPYHAGGRNDHVFLVHASDSENIDKFGDILEAVCRTHPSAMQYRHAEDAPYGLDWNPKGYHPTSSRCGWQNPSVKLSTSLETAYFGTAGNVFTQEAAIAYGRCVGEALLQFLAE